MSYKITSQNATEPVSLGEAKLYIKADGSDDDEMISGLISSARKYLENRTGKQLTLSTMEVHLDAFPIINPILTYSISLPLQIPINPQSIIQLPIPLVSVVSVVYRDSDEASQTMDSSNYVVDLAGGRLQIINSPSTSQYMDAVVITCTTGNCPVDLKQALLEVIAEWYIRREPNIPSNLSPRDDLERIIWNNRDITFA